MIEAISTAFTFVLTILVGIIGMLYKNQAADIKKLEAEQVAMALRLEKLISTAITEKEVRVVFKEQLDPLALSIKELTIEFHNLKLELASRPKRFNDVSN